MTTPPFFASKHIVAILSAALALLAAPTTAQAANAFVDEDSGSDANPCTQAQPCATVQAGVNQAGMGETVFVDGDEYTEMVTLAAGKSLTAMEFAGAADPPSIIDGGVGTGVLVTGTPAGTIQGFTIRGDIGGINLDEAVTAVSGNTFDEASDSTTMVAADPGSGASTVSGNLFTGNASVDTIAINFNNVPLVISGNQFNNVSTAMLFSGDFADASISGNTITGTHAATFGGAGIDIRNDADPTLTGNLIHMPGAGGIIGITVFEDTGTGDPTSLTMSRNRILGAFSTSVRIDDTTGPVTLNSDAIAGNATGNGLVIRDGALGGVGPGQADATLNNLTVAGNNPDLTAESNVLTINSMIVEDPISATMGPVTCAISFSRGPTTTGNSCQTFQTSAAPMFAADGYHLLAGSPMLEMGDPAAPAAPNDLDVDGQSRAIDENCDGVVRRNIGADEIPTTCPGPTPSPTPTPLTPTTTAPTGQRAAALKKCKKKRSARARKKCRKKANQLPV